VKLVFSGPPGAGKGTQAERISSECGLAHASTGDIFRNAVAEGSELGQQVESYLDAGKLVTDRLTSDVVKEMVLLREADFILDGYPRTVRQAEQLDEMLEELGFSLDAVLFFELSEEEATERLTGRRVCENCKKNYHVKFMPPRQEGICDECGGKLIVRSDSSEEVVRKRLEEYKEKTAPLVGFYEARGLLKRIDASQPPDMVTAEAKQVVKDLRS
jgi:adenylate kinase